MLKISKTKKFKEENYSSYFRNVELVMVIWYFMQMSSILCMFEETKNCQVHNTFVLETKKCWIFSLYFEKPGMFRVYFMSIWGNTKCQVLYECIQESTTCWLFFHVYFEKTQNVQYFMHIQETTNVEYFMGMPITLYTHSRKHKMLNTLH